MQTSLLFESVEEIFERVFRELRPRTAAPEFSVQFYPYANIDSRIRLNAERTHVRVRMSDVFEGAPAPVREALAYILVAKLYRKPIPKKYSHRYRLFVNRADIRHKALLLRQMRGRKQITSAQGRVFDLEAMFRDLNTRLFDGLLAEPQLTWSPRVSRRMLGHWDPAHNTIVISRIFDRPRVPRFLVEYILYHEMLHLKYPAEYRTLRRCVHTAAFKAEERRFPRFDEAVKLLKQL
jgi:predicted metal-dependent hydrolase